MSSVELGALFLKIQDLPPEARKDLLSVLKQSNFEFTPAGAVLIAMQLLSLLGVPQLIDKQLGKEHTPIEQLKADYQRGEKPVPSPGIIVCIVIADMLAYPKEMARVYKIEELAHSWHTGILLGICPTLLNDDRILGAFSLLGACRETLEEIMHSLTVSVAQRFDIPLSRFFTDTTLLQLDGEFAEAPKVTAGRGRDSFSQLLVSLVAAAGSRLPVFFAVLPGNTNDGTTLPQVLPALDRVAPPGPIEIIFDRAYVTANNVLHLQRKEEDQPREFRFIGPLKTEKAGKRFRDMVDAVWDNNQWQPINYRSAQEIKQGIECSYNAFETTWTLTQLEKPPLESDETRRPSGSIIRHDVTVRCTVYRNDYRAKLEQKARSQKRQGCEAMLQDFATKINKRNLITEEDCQKKTDEILKRFGAVKDFVDLKFSTNEHGAVIFSWSWKEETFTKQERYDGIFALLTNHPSQEVPAPELIGRYRERNQIEMNYRDLKGLLDLEQMFLRLPDRIDAYVFLKILAYFVLAFLRWYAEEKGKKKVTEKKIQEAIGHLAIGKIEIQPLAIPKWSLSNDNGLARWFRSSLGLPDPQEIVEQLNRLVKVDQLIQRWLEKWEQTRIQKSTPHDTG